MLHFENPTFRVSVKRNIVGYSKFLVVILISISLEHYRVIIGLYSMHFYF